MDTSFSRRRLGPVLLLLAIACAETPAPATDSDSIAAQPTVADGATGGDSLVVRIDEQVRPTAAGDSLPTVTFTGGAGEIRVRWDVQSGPCLLAEGSAARTGNEVTIRIARRGDPAALCERGEVVYQYEIRVGDLPAGEYRVTLVEAPLREADRPAGTGSVSVTAAGI